MNQRKRKNIGGSILNKIYILDTNVLLDDPQSIFSFEENEVVIPSTVMEEIERHIIEKRQFLENAKGAYKLIQTLLSSKKGETVRLKNGGTFKIETNQKPLEFFKEDANDNRILATVNYLHSKEKAKENGKTVLLVSYDNLIKIKADALGLYAESYSPNRK